MQSIKAEKQIAIDEVIESKSKPTAETLMRLFGPVGADEDGHPFIFADSDELNPEDPRLTAVDEDDEEGFLGDEE